jgi:hypothetical protein
MECQKSFQIPWCITKSCHQLFPLVSWTPEQSVSARFLKKHDSVSFRRFHFSAKWPVAPPLFLNKGLTSAKERESYMWIKAVKKTFALFLTAFFGQRKCLGIRE